MQFRDFVPILSARKHLTLSDVDQEGFPLSELLENLEKVNAWSFFFSFLLSVLNVFRGISRFAHAWPPRSRISRLKSLAAELNDAYWIHHRRIHCIRFAVPSMHAHGFQFSL